jgi:hypothetical protein
MMRFGRGRRRGVSGGGLALFGQNGGGGMGDDRPFFAGKSFLCGGKAEMEFRVGFGFTTETPRHRENQVGFVLQFWAVQGRVGAVFGCRKIFYWVSI